VEGLGKDLKVLSKYECGLVVGPLNKVKGDFGQQSLRFSGKSTSGIIFGKSLGKRINLRLKFQNGKFTNMWLAIMLKS
jgi:hypothetical protein